MLRKMLKSKKKKSKKKRNLTLKKNKNKRYKKKFNKKTLHTIVTNSKKSPLKIINAKSSSKSH